MGVLIVPIPEPLLVQRTIYGPAVESALEQQAQAIFDSLATLYPKGNFIGAELSAGAAGGVVSAVITGTNDDVGGLLTWADPVPRFAIGTPNALTFDARLAAIAAEQSASGDDVLYGVDYALSGDGAVLVYAQLWGPSLG